jgi:hypothetical protein
MVKGSRLFGDLWMLQKGRTGLFEVYRIGFHCNIQFSIASYYAQNTVRILPDQSYCCIASEQWRDIFGYVLGFADNNLLV